MRWSAHIHTAFHVCSATLDTPRANADFGYGGVTLYARSFQILLLSLLVSHRSPNPEEISSVWALPVSLATTCGIDFSFFSSAYWDVSLQRVSRTLSYLPHLRGFGQRRCCITSTRLSHSEISGSKCICHSPKLIAAYHVLHRHSAPRHPLCALISLISFESCLSLASLQMTKFAVILV